LYLRNHKYARLFSSAGVRWVRRHPTLPYGVHIVNCSTANALPCNNDRTKVHNYSNTWTYNWQLLHAVNTNTQTKATLTANIKPSWATGVTKNRWQFTMFSIWQTHTVLSSMWQKCVDSCTPRIAEFAAVNYCYSMRSLSSVYLNRVISQLNARQDAQSTMHGCPLSGLSQLDFSLVDRRGSAFDLLCLPSSSQIRVHPAVSSDHVTRESFLRMTHKRHYQHPVTNMSRDGYRVQFMGCEQK